MSDTTDRASDRPFAPKKFLDVHGHRMAYIDEGEGAAIVFQHGNPTSSYLWRNVMPECTGLGRLIACDLAGFGDSDKLDPKLGVDRYSYQQQRERLFALWEELRLGDQVVLVLHDIGSIYGFDWANQHRDRVQGIAYAESLVGPLQSTDFPAFMREAVKSAFTPASRDAVMRGDVDFIEQFVFGTQELSPVAQAYYRKPFLIPGEDRRPMVGTEFSVDGRPEDTTKIMDDYARWLSESEVPKLMISAEPGYLLTGRLRDFARTWRNHTEVSVTGSHFVQESSPREVGVAVADFVRRLRGG